MPRRQRKRPARVKRRRGRGGVGLAGGGVAMCRRDAEGKNERAKGPIWRLTLRWASGPAAFRALRLASAARCYFINGRKRLRYLRGTVGTTSNQSQHRFW